MGRAQRLVSRCALLVTIASAASAIAVTGAANADQDRPTAENKRRAKQLYDLGKKLFAAKEFAEAAKTFAESFTFDPRPGALFNQGRCHEEAGDKPSAISAFKRYLVLEPAGDAAEEARTRTLALERQIELEKGVAGSGHDTDADDEPRPGRNLRLAGIATGGTGLVLFATGAYFGLKAGSIESELEDRDGPWTDEELARFDDGERAEAIGVSLLAIGSAAIIGGGVLYYLGHRAKSSEVDVQPSISPDGASATIRVRF